MLQKQTHVFEVTVEITVTFEVIAFTKQQVEDQVQKLLDCSFPETNTNLLNGSSTITIIGITPVSDEPQPSLQKEKYHA